MTKRKTAIEWVMGFALCVALGMLYFATRTEVHTFDALSYTWALEDKPFGLLFHPHHLFYGPAGWLVYRGAQALGYAGRADVPVQALNAAAGALGAFFLWRFGTRWTGRSWAALGVAALMGTSYAYWVYAAEVEVYTLATAFLALVLWLLVRLDERPSPGWAAAVGLAHMGAIMFHQTNVLFGLAVAAFLWLRPSLRRFSIYLAYGLGVAVPVLLAYGYVAYASQFPDFPAFYNWLTDYAQSGQWGGFLSFAHFPALRSGLQTAVSPNPRLAGLFYGLVVVGMGTAVYRAWRDAEKRAWVGFALVWQVSYLLFFWWWEPWNIEFWIATLPLAGVWLLAAWGGGETTETQRTQSFLSGKLDFYVTSAAVFLSFLLAGLLLQAHWQPIQTAGDRGNDYYREVTDRLAEVVGPEELVVTRGNILDLYVPFYAEHPFVLSMRALTQEKGGDRAQIMGELIGQLDYAWVTGRPFLIDQFILDEPQEPIRNPFGLLPEEIAAIKERFVLEPVAFRGEQPLFYGTPRYESDGRTAWTFADSLQGWSAWGIDSPRFEDGGWCFSAGVDPQLKGPIINLDANAYQTLRLEMSVTGESSFAQLFWRSPEEEYSLDNSLEIPLAAGRGTAVVDLSDAPHWENIIAQVRLDPVPGHEGDAPPVTACVHSLRFE